MALHYTKSEGGFVSDLPIKSNHTKVVRQLFKNRFVNKGVAFSHVRVPATPYPYLVQAVFFSRHGVVTKIWDANINGYRKMPKTKMYLPWVKK